MKYKIDYAFDPVGNVTNRVITGLQGLSGTITTRYQYDVMNRLTNVVQLTNEKRVGNGSPISVSGQEGKRISGSQLFFS